MDSHKIALATTVTTSGDPLVAHNYLGETNGDDKDEDELLAHCPKVLHQSVAPEKEQQILRQQLSGTAPDDQKSQGNTEDV